MAQEPRASDRRREARYDIVGHLRGTLSSVETMLLRNLSLGGALVESLRRYPPGSVHTLHFEREMALDGIVAKVLRVAPLAKRRYQVAVEFPRSEPTALVYLRRILRDWKTPESSEAAHIDDADSARPSERRRSPRRVAADMTVRLHTVTDAEILDISQTGVLFKCERQLEGGDRAQIRTLLKRQPLVAWLSVCWTRRTSPGGFRVGAKFIDLDDNAEGTIRRSLR